MAAIFSDNAGKFAVIKGAGLPSLISVEGFKPTMAAVTSVRINQACNVQIQPTLDNSIYVYAFGDRMGQATVSGITFSRTCDGSNSSGLAQIYEYFQSNKISSSLKHITLTVGSKTLIGFLHSVQFAIESSEQQVFNYSLEIYTVPEMAKFSARDGDSGSTATDESSTASAASTPTTGGTTSSSSGSTAVASSTPGPKTSPEVLAGIAAAKARNTESHWQARVMLAKAKSNNRQAVAATQAMIKAQQLKQVANSSSR